MTSGRGNNVSLYSWSQKDTQFGVSVALCPSSVRLLLGGGKFSRIHSIDGNKLAKIPVERRHVPPKIRSKLIRPNETPLVSSSCMSQTNVRPVLVAYNTFALKSR